MDEMNTRTNEIGTIEIVTGTYLVARHNERTHVETTETEIGKTTGPHAATVEAEVAVLEEEADRLIMADLQVER